MAELGIYMMIGLSRDVREMSKSLAEKRMGQPQGRGLNGRAVGLIGLGGIGRALVKRLKAFGVYLIGIKRNNPKDAKEKLGMEWVGGIKDLPDPNDPIFNYNVMATPHIGGSTDVSMRGIVKIVAKNIRRLEKNLKPLYLK